MHFRTNPGLPAPPLSDDEVSQFDYAGDNLGSLALTLDCHPNIKSESEYDQNSIQGSSCERGIKVDMYLAIS